MIAARVAAWAVLAAACHSPAAPPSSRLADDRDVRAPDDPAPAVPAPGPRLPDALAPVAYDLTLQLDPDRGGFRGHVEITLRAAEATDTVWLHAVDLDITTATTRDAAGATGPLVPVGTGEEMLGYHLAHPLAAGAETTLVFDYAGGTSHDQQGLFRQQVRGRWYLYAQSESVFARRILPCFDEPRWKPVWRVRLAIPHGMVGVGNAPERARHVRPDGRLEVELAPTPPMPSYLLAVAVGPFDVLDAGRVGRGNVPVRVVVPAGDGARAGVAAERLPAIVDALEAYFDNKLPVAKLDFVGIPHFFGGMENPGLVSMAEHLLVADAAEPSERRAFQRFAAHELAHLWLGDLVTPAWWDDLWLAEAFATWLGDRVLVATDGFDDVALRAAEARELAIDADGLPDPRPLRRAVTHGADAEAAFDAIAYDKGAAVLAMLEHWLGEVPMRDAIRRFVHAHANGTATSADFIHGFAATPAVADVLTSYVDHPGVPVVDLALHCDAHPATVAASLRAPGVAVPLCVRYPGGRGPAETCGVVAGERGELVLAEAAGCPAWVITNAGGAGYYTAQWLPLGVGPVVPTGIATPAERLAAGTDIANAVARGDLAPTAALAELTRLAASSDPYAVLAALAIARALAPLVDETTAPRWAEYLAAQLAAHLGPEAMLAPATPAWRAVRDRILELVPADRLPTATVARARGDLERVLVGGLAAVRVAPLEVPSTIAGPSAGHAALVSVLALAARTEDPELREELYAAAGAFGPGEIGTLLAAVTAPDGSAAWPALQAYLERPATAVATWAAVRDQLAAVLARLSPAETAELLGTAATLCEARPAALVAVAFEPELGKIPGGRRALERALAVADRCVARRARAGALATALRR